jgi:outer membrane protein OmpA-like peptidoglycan-associated protein
MRVCRPIGSVAALAWILVTVACATPQNADLDRAHARYQKAMSDSSLDPQNSVDLYEAKKSLDHADDLLSSRAEQEVVSHYAYLADLRISLAETSADTKVTRAEAEALLAQRREIQLDARTLEADRSLARARSAEAQAAEAEATAQSAQLRLQELEGQMAELEARQTERGLLLTLGGVLFEFGKADLKGGAKSQLDRVAGFLIANPDRQVVIEGHTDDVGGDDFNLRLSQARAESVRDYLALQGVAGLRLAARGYGKSHPVASNETDSGRAQNRRVELTILDPGVFAAGALR